MVFATSTARATALAFPTEGMVTYLQDTNSTQYYTGSAWASLATLASPTFTGNVTLSSGNITIPNQPAFYAQTTSPSGIVQTNTVILLNNPIVNRGSAYNSSNGRFTCSTAGLYQFFFGTIKTDGKDADVSRFRIRKNGTNASTELRLSESGGYGESSSLVCLIACNVNDYVDVFIGADTGGWYGNQYAHFGGFLIG
jgi:hypothetical protein